MVDREQAQDALAEIRGRQDEVSAIAWREFAPSWWVAAASVLLLGSAALQDVRMQFPSWNGTVLRWVVPLLVLLALALLGVLAQRRMRLRPDRSTGRAATAFAVLAVACLLLTIGIGTWLRSNDVPWDQTLSLGAALPVVLVVGSAWRAVELRRAGR
ncbi:hypothetical protein [Pseudonocardia sp. MH-G8]|uniref:hypothetical protein n=1 Tax=Pseudonocardia sp. MH-G8 TaxID=1854588 RepID=UPI000BA1099A|nr:hypothetical protein [Pseudonocardia sp. MH-G8]OZM79090.1 hypothetical protein CFP66_27590 [Pseudonocardia sp. MH-G8]